MNNSLGKLASSQTSIDLTEEVNFELSKKDLEEAVKLSGYSKRENIELSSSIEDKPITSTQRFWAVALTGLWKTMIDINGWKLPATLDSYSICGKGFFKKCSQDNFVRKFVYHCGRIASMIWLGYGFFLPLVIF